MAHLAFHALSIGGGVLAVSHMPGLGGDYEADLNDIGAWRPSLVVTLTSQGELADHNALTLGADVRARAARWEHLPIVDRGIPNKAFETRWPRVAEKSLLALRGGGRVLLHCKGGCGRSGMVALRLMVEAGEKPSDALGKLRAVRPCAVETDAQFEWAAKGTRRKLPAPGGLHCS